LSADFATNPALLFEPFGRLSGLLLAVSGGPDSMALLHLAAAWRDSAPNAPRICAATVDHGLRPEATREAERVADWSRTRGIAHKTLIWEGEKPATGIQARARIARYRLLFDHMRDIGATALATAHHADDQWETVMIRLARGSGIAGLAGMSRDQNVLGGRIVRPLLDLPKAELTDYCRRCGQDFLDDPSNANPRFARSQWREHAEALHGLGLTRERTAKFSERARKCDQALQWAAARFLEDVSIPTEIHVYDLSGALQTPTAIIEHFLQLALTRLTGIPVARLERVERLAGKLDAALRAETTLFATLGGCALTLTRDRLLRIGLEPQRKRGL